MLRGCNPDIVKRALLSGAVGLFRRADLLQQTIAWQRIRARQVTPCSPCAGFGSRVLTAREARTVARISRQDDQLPDVLTVAKVDGHDPAARLRAVGEARHVLAFDQLAQEGRRQAGKFVRRGLHSKTKFNMSPTQFGDRRKFLNSLSKRRAVTSAAR